jgi:hypothetical protein
MKNDALRTRCKRSLLILALVLIPVAKGFAQESPFTASMKATMVQPAASGAFIQHSYVRSSEIGEQKHRFWDRENTILFTAVGASAAADFCVTRANLANGGRELNPVTRVFAGSTTGLAFNFVGETVGTMGLSYLFHKTGHHRLERLTSLLETGSSAGAVGYGLTHR